MLTRDAVQRFGEFQRFAFDGSEKILRLAGILGRLASHDATVERWVLKGGTALNLLHLGLPRLSVDIDINYVGALDREAMLADRPDFERGIEQCCALEGCAVRRAPGEHAGGKFRLRYASLAGGGRGLEVDVNYVARLPLFGREIRSLELEGMTEAVQAPVLSLPELAAGKFAALTSRSAARDHFDAASLLEHDPGLVRGPDFRLAFTCLAAAARVNYLVTAHAVEALDVLDVEQRLVPLLRMEPGSPRSRAIELRRRLDEAVRPAAREALAWTENEHEFIRRLNQDGELAPALLSNDEDTQRRVAAQPMLQWKRANVRRHLGLSERP